MIFVRKANGNLAESHEASGTEVEASLSGSEKRFGTSGETRTPTVIHRWILNPLRLPIPPPRQVPLL